MLARDAVLHLREADQADVRVDAIARVDVLGAAHQRGDRPVQPRDHAREAAPETAGETERGVLEEDVLDEGLRLAGRLRVAVSASRGERERPARVGHHEGLPVIMRVDVLVEAREHIVE